jgi:predicted RNase H-like HicB family nuclease
MTEYTVVIEDAGSNLSAYLIELDGVVTTGETVDEVLDNMREAIPFHLEGLRMNGADLPVPPIVRALEIQAS